MAAIPNKNVNPILALLANLFCFSCLGLILLGQSSKALWSFLLTLIGSFLCGLPGLFMAVVSAIDAMQVAQAVQKGEQVDENEYKFKLAYSIAKILNKNAIYKGQ